VFVRVLGDDTASILSKSTGNKVRVAEYYSPYSRGFARWVPSLYLWKLLDEIKDTDQRFDATLLTHYNIPPELAGNVTKYYPDMANQTFKDYAEAWAEDGNYFNGGGYAVRYVFMDGDSQEGKDLQAQVKNKYRALKVNPAVQNLIREGKTHQIDSMIQTNKKLGMITMDDALYELALDDQIGNDVALSFAQDPNALEKKLSFM